MLYPRQGRCWIAIINCYYLFLYYIDVIKKKCGTRDWKCLFFNHKVNFIRKFESLICISFEGYCSLLENKAGDWYLTILMKSYAYVGRVPFGFILWTSSPIHLLYRISFTPKITLFITIYCDIGVNFFFQKRQKRKSTNSFTNIFLFHLSLWIIWVYFLSIYF